jgi:hypothetical protein
MDLGLTSVECNAETKVAVIEATGNLRHFACSLTLDEYTASRHLLVCVTAIDKRCAVNHKGMQGK